LAIHVTELDQVVDDGRPVVSMPAGQLEQSTATRVPVSVNAALPPTTFVPFHGVNDGLSGAVDRPWKRMSVFVRWTLDFPKLRDNLTRLPVGRRPTIIAKIGRLRVVSDRTLLSVEAEAAFRSQCLKSGVGSKGSV